MSSATTTNKTRALTNKPQVLSLALALALAGCSSSSSSSSADAGLDGSAPRSDQGRTNDAPPPPDAKGLAVDATVPPNDDGAGGDGPSFASDSGPSAYPTCKYTFDRQVVVRCPKLFAYINHYVTSVPGCDAVWSAGGKGPTAPTAREAALAVGCDVSCIWEAFQSVMYVRCGHRDEYFVYRTPGCDDVYGFATGIYSSVEDHHQEHPCP